MKTIVAGVLALVLTTGLPRQGMAQGFAVGAALNYHMISGEDFEGTDAGFGFQGFGRLAFPSGFALGAGVQFNNHDITGIEPNLKILGLFVEPRYHFTVANSILEPFVAGRVYYVHNSVSQGGDEVTANGFALAALGGMYFQLAPQFGLEPAVSYTYLSFGDAKFNGTTIDGTDGSGSSLGVQLAFVVSFRAQ